jgi:chloride channel 7
MMPPHSGEPHAQVYTAVDRESHKIEGGGGGGIWSRFNVAHMPAKVEAYESLDYNTGLSKMRRGLLQQQAVEERSRGARGTADRQLCGMPGPTAGRWALAATTGACIGVLALSLGKMIELLLDYKIERLERKIEEAAELDPFQAVGDSSAAAGKDTADPDEWGFTGGVGSPLLDFALVNLLLATAACLPTVLFVPEAAGSGIPEVMGYLNGVHIPRFLRFRTLLAKLWGTCLIVASGVAVGPEGPLVHAGAIVGSGLTRGPRQFGTPTGAARAAQRAQLGTPTRSRQQSDDPPASAQAEVEGGCWHWVRRWQTLLHNDTDRRDFISMGAAAGFATAFGAPIGGVLFALEEASTFWSDVLMWRTLLCTSVGCFTLSILKGFMSDNVDKQPGGANYRFEPGMLTLNTDESLHFTSEWELLLCAVEGVLGGILGALFNKLHTMLAARRPKPHPPAASSGRQSNEEDGCMDECGSQCPSWWGRWRQVVLRVLEVVAISILTSVVSYGLPYIGSDQVLGFACQPEAKALFNDEFDRLHFYCNEQLMNGDAEAMPFYNDIATVFLTSRENSVLQLIEHPHDFSYGSLLTMTVSFFVLMLLSFGAAFPAGIFMPTIVIGTCGGALFGRLIKDSACMSKCGVGCGCFEASRSSIPAYNSSEYPAKCFADAPPHAYCVTDDPVIDRSGPYALLGAVALLGGIQRSSLSLVVIIMEGTGKVDYLLPIILTTICAKWAGDHLNHGLYHTVLALKGIPFLDAPDAEGSAAADVHSAQDIMAADPVVLHGLTSVKDVVAKLTASPLRNAFPVVAERPVPGGRPGAVIEVFIGLVMRHELTLVLGRKRFYRKAAVEAAPDEPAAETDGATKIETVHLERIEPAYNTRVAIPVGLHAICHRRHG